MRAGLKTFHFLLIAAFLATGCSQIMGNLRRDLDDSEPASGPTIGGSWSERGLLDDDRYAAVGHAERNPASGSNGGARGRESWITQEDVENNQRDNYRNPASEDENGESGDMAYSNSPSAMPPVKRLYKNGSRATRADFIDEAPNEGSLWASDGQTNYYFTKNKIRGVGDILTIKVEEGLIKDTGSEISRTLTPKEKDAELQAAQERLAAKAYGLSQPGDKSVATSAAAPARDPAAANGKDAPKESGDVVVPRATASDIDVTKSLEFKADDTIMAEIVERYPNGNYKIRGTKRIRYRNGFRVLSLVGIARGTDISEDDIINSGKLYEYRLQVLR